MITKRKALFTGMLFLLLFTTACGGAAPATQAPAAIPPAANYEPRGTSGRDRGPGCGSTLSWPRPSGNSILQFRPIQRTYAALRPQPL